MSEQNKRIFRVKTWCGDSRIGQPYYSSDSPTALQRHNLDAAALRLTRIILNSFVNSFVSSCLEFRIRLGCWIRSLKHGMHCPRLIYYLPI